MKVIVNMFNHLMDQNHLTEEDWQWKATAQRLFSNNCTIWAPAEIGIHRFTK